MVFIQDLREGDHVSQVFLCRQKTNGTTKTGRSYYNVKLQDKTGQLDAKIWDLTNAIEHFESNDFILAEGDVISYNNALQLNIRRVRRANSGEYDPKEYLPTSELSIDVMYKELMGLAEKITHPKMRELVNSFFLEDQAFIQAFKTHSAAKSVHHNFMGGLLQHTLRVTQLCYFYCQQYPMLNKDLLLAAAMFHDIGKLYEISDFPENDYTDEGQLIGHIVIGTQNGGVRKLRVAGISVKNGIEVAFIDRTFCSGKAAVEAHAIFEEESVAGGTVGAGAVDERIGVINPTGDPHLVAGLSGIDGGLDAAGSILPRAAVACASHFHIVNGGTGCCGTHQQCHGRGMT